MDSRLHNPQQRREARRSSGGTAPVSSANSRQFSPQQHHHHQFLPLPQQQLPPYQQQQQQPQTAHHHHHHPQQQQYHHPQQHPHHHHHLQQQQQQHQQHQHSRLSSIPSGSASLIDDASRRFPPLVTRSTPSGVPVPVDHSDYASIIAYRQRVNSHASPLDSAPSVPAPLARNQTQAASVWPPHERLRNSSAETRIPVDEASRHGRQLSFAKDTRDDLRSMSELDNSRRSAAISAKLFLDERRSGRLTSQRGGTYEPSVSEVSRRHVDKDVSSSHDFRGYQSLAERLRKRLRDDPTDLDKDRNSRNRKFYDPGLAVLPRTPEAPTRNVPLVRRMVASGRLAPRESDDRNETYNMFNRSRSPKDRRASSSSYNSPSKSSKKKQQRKSLPSEGSLPLHVQRLEEPEKKLSSGKDLRETNLKIREPHFSELQPRDKPAIPKLDAPDLCCVENDADNSGKSVADEIKSVPSSEELEVGEWKPVQRTKKVYKNVGKALRIVEASPRNKSVKSRIVRLIGSDAKVCAGSPKSRLSEMDSNREGPFELDNMDHYDLDEPVGILQDGEPSKILADHAPTVFEISKEHKTRNSECLSPEVQIPFPLASQVSVPSRGEPSSSPVCQYTQEKEQQLSLAKTLVPQNAKDDLGTLNWHTSSENPNWSTIDVTMPLNITSTGNQPLSMEAESEGPELEDLHRSCSPMEKENMEVKEFLPLTSKAAFSLSQLCSQSMLTPECANGSLCDTDEMQNVSLSSLFPSMGKQVLHSGKHVSSSSLCMFGLTPPYGDGLLESKEGVLRNIPSHKTVETEVRLFGKSLKASVTNVKQDKGQITAGLFSKKINQMTLQMDSAEHGTITNDVTDLTTELLNSNQGGSVASVPNHIQQISVPLSSKTVTETVSQVGIIPNATCLIPKHASQEQRLVGEPLKNMQERSADEVVKPPASSISTLATKCIGSLDSLSYEASETQNLAVPHPISESPSVTKDLPFEHQVHVRSPDKLISDFSTDNIPKSTSATHSDIQSQEVITECLEKADGGTSNVIVDDIMASSDQATESQAKISASDVEDGYTSDVLMVGNSVKADTSLADRTVTLTPTPSKQLAATAQPAGRVQSIPSRIAANTWRRSANSPSISAPPMMSKVLKPPFSSNLQPWRSQKVSEVAAYVRKGNSLVRASVPSNLPVASSLPIAPLTAHAKDVAVKGFSKIIRAPNSYQGFRKAINNTKSVFKNVFSAQKTSSHDGTSSSLNNDRPSATSSISNLSRDPVKSPVLLTSESLPGSSVAKTVGSDDRGLHVAALETSSSIPGSSLESKQPLPIVQMTNVLKKPDISTFYIKNKANQLIASLPPMSSMLTGPVHVTTHLTAKMHTATTQDVYYKRKKNQLVRNGIGTKSNSLQNHAVRIQTQGVWQSNVKKALRRRYLPQSRVWTLKHGSTSQVKSVLPLLFPWKRPAVGLSVRAGRFKALPKAKKGSLLFLISKKLQRLRKAQPVYSRSSGGFSLHRSGVLSLSGANLKWTKSIEKRSKQASEEATKAVAAVEKQRREEKAAVVEAANAVAKAKVHRRVSRRASHGRERVVMVGLVHYKMDPSGRTLQRLPDQWSDPSGESSAIHSRGDSAMLSTPRRLSLDGTQYVRIGNGNKLVRDPKAVSRALASEKVRWSLHTARSRRAKKQQYCLFFTRFGKCNKSEGECPYIHDPEKVAVCTKFLKGTCSGTNCLFSHKVIPERMPDCSFFLEGVCTNEKCPYRHVSVNPKAPICEGFLKGFCVDGDECKHKHSTVCPSFAATGECPDKSSCKLHHPKMRRKRVLNASTVKTRAKKKRRYFVVGSNEFHEQIREHSGQAQSAESVETAECGTMDVIRVPEVTLDTDEVDEFKRKFATLKEQLPFLQEGFRKDSDMWIMPILLLKKTISA